MEYLDYGQNRGAGSDDATTEPELRDNANEIGVADHERYRALVEIGSDYAYYATVAQNGDIRLEWVTGDFEGVTGYTIEGLNRIGWAALVHPDEHERTLAIVSSFASGKAWIGELKILRGDGHEAWTRTAARPILDDSNNLIGIYGAVQDITERKRAEQELREAESRYRDLVEQIPGVVYLAEQGIRGRWHFVGSKIRSLLGFSPEEWLADPNLWFDHVYPEDQDMVLEIDSTVHLHDSEGRTVEYRMVARDGDVVWIRDAQTFQDDGPNRPALIRGVLFDITREKSAERALLHSEQMYRSLFFHHPDAVFSLDLEGRFRSLNPQGAALSGYSFDELEGESFARLVPAHQLADTVARFERAVQGQVQEYEVGVIRKDGAIRDLVVTNMPIVVEGEVVGVFGIAKDVTEKKLLQEQMLQAQKMEALGQLAGGLAHDFNNLLSVILNYSDVIKNDLSDPDRVLDDLSEISNAAERASDLTKQLLIFSRRQATQLRVVDLNAVVRSITTMLERTAGDKVSVRTNLAPYVLQVRVDPVDLERTLIDLTINARDAMPQGGNLTISTDALEGAPGSVRLTVSDDGKGMAEEVRRRALDPFFTTKEAGTASGLGLSTAFGTVRRWDGSLELVSEEGRGTDVHIVLPAVGEEVSGDSAPRAPSAMRRKVSRILVVDDEEALRKVTARILEKRGLEVLALPDAAAAIDAVEHEPDRFDVIVTDVVMPRMSGIEMVRELRERGHAIRAVYMSGYSADVIEAEGRPDGPLIEKPFSANDLVAAIEDVFAE